MIDNVNFYAMRIRRKGESQFAPERWLGKLGSPAGGKVADPLSLTSFQVTSGADALAFGTAVQILDANDTPNVAGMNAFAIKRIRISAVGAASETFRLRIAYGQDNEQSYAAAVANEHFTEVIATGTGEYIDVYMPLLDLKSKVWVAAADADSDATTIDLMFSIVEYAE